MRGLVVLALLVLIGCAPVSPSEPKSASHDCPAVNNYNAVNAGDSQYDVQSKMGQQPSSETTTVNSGQTQIVDTYVMCRQFVYTFDYSGHLVAKSEQ